MMAENKSKEELRKELRKVQEEILNIENDLKSKYELESKISKELIKYNDGKESELDYLNTKRHLKNISEITRHKYIDENPDMAYDLTKQELRYQTLIDCIPDSVYVLDKDLKFVILNKSYLKELGVKKENLIGNKINDLFPVVENFKFFKVYNKVLKTRKAEAVLEEIMFRGEKRWFEVYIYPYPDGILCISSDVTDRKKANEKIKESKEKYELLFNNMINGFSYQKIILDDEGKPIDWVFLEVNKAFESLTGYKRDQVIGRKASEVYPNLHSLEVDWVGLYSRVALEGKDIKFEEYLEPLNRWYSLFVYSPKKYYFAVIFQDITDHREYEQELEKFNKELTRTNEELETLSEELKQTNEEYEQTNEELYATNTQLERQTQELKEAYSMLEKSEAKFRTLFEQSPIAISIFDKEGNVIDINPKARELYGIKDVERLKKDYNIFTSLSLTDEVKDKIKQDRSFSFDTVFKFKELQGVRKNYGIDIHNDLYAHIFITPVKDSEYNIDGYISMTMDITNLKKAEMELKKTNRRLAQSNEDLKQFANIASHDLIEPIRMISSFTDIIKDDYYKTFTDEGKSYIDIIQNGIERLNEVVTDLLEYSRTDRNDIKLEDCDIGKVIKNVLFNLSKQIEKTNAQIIYDEDKLPIIKADCFQMEQLLQNLLSNAIKFVKDKRPIVNIDAYEKQDEWVFSVKDNGIGINEMYHNKIFDIFQRLHSKEEFAGTGIGLAIVKKVIDKHSGRIWLESEEGVGSTFFFDIPKA
jgi:PAS domain S-box-containing protein